MISQIVEIAKRSAQYVANMNANIIRVVESNKDLMIDINRSQFISSKDATGKPLTRVSTGSTKLSKAYARKAGKSKPDFFLSGQFQDEMIFFMPNEKEYFINSRVRPYLSPQYGGSIFGVTPNNQSKAKDINDKLVVEDYKKFTFQ
ncbi:MAG TPA: hypothetical protein VIK55_06675 [Paludibacter sp.]